MVLTLEDALGSLAGHVKTQMAGLFDSIGLGRTQEFAFLMYSHDGEAAGPGPLFENHFQAERGLILSRKGYCKQEENEV